MRISLLLLFFFIGLKTMAQQGYLYLKHFEVPLPNNQYFFNDLTTDDQNRLLIAHRSGILQFDGKIWDKINTQSTPHQFITIDEATFVLTKNTISHLESDHFKQNILSTVFVNPVEKAGNDLLKFHDSYYYLLDKKIYQLDTTSFEVDTVFESSLGYEDIFSFQNRFFAFEGNYLLEYVEGTWVDLNKYVPQNSDFVFSCQTEARVFFAYDNGDFFIFDGEQLERYSEPLTQYLKENYPVSGKVIGDKLLVATVSGGAVVVNIRDGRIDYTIQYHNGLPADEVKAITIDKQGGIWLAHDAGLSRAIPELPIKEFQNYPGLKGLPNQVYYSKDTLWVGTNVGLYFLEAIKDYEEFKQVLSRRVLVKQKTGSQNQEEEDDSLGGLLSDLFEKDDPTTEDFISEKLDVFKDKLKDQGFRFRGLKERLQEKESQLRDSISNAASVSTRKKPAEKKQYKTVERVVNASKLKSIKYQFTEISGIDKKVVQISAISSNFYALASDGLYIINDGKAQKIWSKLFVTGMQYDQQNGILWLYGAEGVYRMTFNEDGRVKEVINSIIDIVVSDMIFEKDHVTISNTNEIRRYFVEEDLSLKSEQMLTIVNPYSQKVLVFRQEEELHVLKADGLYTYNVEANELELLESYEEKQLSYLKDNLGQVWISTGSNWKILNQGEAGQEYNWLRILPSMSSIHSTGSRYIYFISSTMIMRLDTEKDYQLEGWDSFIRGAYQASSEMFDGEDVKLTHDNNTLKVSISTPEYLFPEGVRYQYFVDGLMDEWSEWSAASEIPFPFLPTGKYTLLVRSKTGIYGGERTLEFDFEVLPPYWQTWWFYMLEIAFFSMLIIVSQRLNRSNKNSYLTNVFTFLTLILFIEFLATVLENNLEGFIGDSPVYGFALNVILALSISPLESWMNKMMVLFKQKKAQFNPKPEEREKN